MVKRARFHILKLSHTMEQQDINLSGFAVVSTDMFTFCPDNPVPGRVTRYTRKGTGMQMADGTFSFVISRNKRTRSKLIRKLAHGRVSRTIDNAIQLTLKIYDTENVDFGNAIVEEALCAADAVRDYQHDTSIEVTISKLP